MDTNRMIFIWIICFCFHSQIDAALEIAVVNGNVTIDNKTQGGYLLYMDENNHNFVDSTPLFEIKGVDNCLDVIVRFLSGTFTYEITNCIFYSKQYFDYENIDQQKFTIKIIYSKEDITLQFYINNIDDEKPTIGSPQCSFEENTIYTSENSTCLCLLKDPDGFFTKMTLTVFSGGADENKIFELALPDGINDTIYESNVTMYNTEMLDYETIRFYSFSISVEDSGHNYINQSAIVDVIDGRDTYPSWMKIIKFAEFPEESKQNFTVSAIDGDTGINSTICYNKIKEDSSANYITVNNETGRIDVDEIDRDKDDINLYSFTINACVCDLPDWCSPQTVDFYIQDIDDNSPLILANNYTNGEIKPFDVNENEVINLSFLENYAGSFNFTTFIKDIDTGENAQFSVNLDQFDEKFDQTVAFFIVPTAGYRSGDFEISVKNATYLDFENDNWQHIQFYLLSSGTKDPSKTNKTLVNITLQDYNDEFPTFKQEQYYATMNETVKTGTIVLEVPATDRDAEDRVLSMEILGNYAKNRLSIDSDGQITVDLEKSDGTELSFDYDILNSVFFQVRATDRVNHSTTVPVTIMISDVNNKAPTIDPIDPVHVEENQIDGISLNVTIRATDPDTTANLSAAINWDNSYATKNSLKLDMTNETIRDFISFLKVRIDPMEGGKDITVSLIVTNSNESKPDFETFDSLYVNLVVIDENTDKDFMVNNQTSAIILISIIDINDNAPYFVEEENANRTVPESAQKGISVGFIKAIDPDIGDNVTISCTADNTTADWVYLDSKNSFIVKDYNLINADVPPRYFFYYSCIANDTVHTSEVSRVSFYIIDTNNKDPQITNLEDIVNITEEYEKNKPVIKIDTPDLDRDIPFHTVNCSLSSNTECSEDFYVGDNNTIIVTRGGIYLDRDGGRTNFSCTVLCQDNIYNERTAGIRSVLKQFTINLLDKNDNTPFLITENLQCSESIKKNTDIAKIKASDIDEGENSIIIFNITSIINTETGKMVSLFYIHQTEDYWISEKFKQVHLFANEDLEGHYGEYIINFELKDKGEPPQVNTTANIKFTIEKFIFKPPVIDFPVASNKTITLSTVQEPGNPLNYFKDKGQLQNFTAEDGATKDCSKWNVTFDIKQLNFNDDNIFFVNNIGPCLSQLQVNKNFEVVNVTGKRYELEVSARIETVGVATSDEAKSFSSVNISISFLENNIEPQFDGRSWTFDFYEDNTTQTQKLEYIPTYVDGETYNTFYELVNTDHNNINDYLTIEKYIGTISVRNKFFCDNVRNFNFQIVASSDAKHRSQDPNSYLDTTVNVKCKNLRPPQFKSKLFFGTIMPGYPANYPVVSIEATDPDIIDKGHLELIIVDVIQRKGDGIDGIKEPSFILQKTSENDVGKVVSTFGVEAAMSGYFKFKVNATDQKDDLGNGPFNTSTDVTVFIITTDNTVDFRFYNNLTQIEDNKIEMLEIVEDIVGYETYYKSIENSTESGVNYTKVSLYFIKRDNNSNTITLQTADTILKIVGNVNTFSNLATELKSKLQLYLYSFPSQIKSNSEAVLRAWLTGVSIALGILSCILLVALVWKIRQLNSRISKLTTKKFGSQDSGLNRLGISAPTTNKHAIEGSNPVYKNEEKKKPKDMSDFDTQSIRSGDSDLIGIENNPEFDYNFNSNDKTTYL